MSARAEPVPTADASGALRAGWLALALAVLAFALYARAGSFGFVEYDDPAYVRDNPHLAHGLTGESVTWALTSTDYQYNWHPLTWISHMLDCQGKRLLAPWPRTAVFLSSNC